MRTPATRKIERMGGAALRALLALALALALAPFLLAGCASTEEPVPDYSDALMSPGAALETISWSEAVDSVGQRLRVEGPVASMRRGDGSTELSLGLPSPDPQRFVVVVPDKVAKRFGAPLADLFEGALVRVTGTIERIDGAPGVRVEKPGQLKAAR